MNSFFDCLDTIFIVEEGKIVNKGEDSFGLGITTDSAYTAVFDGSGGLGSRIYPEFDDHTGAYIASRLISRSFNEWYDNYHDYYFESADSMIDSVTSFFNTSFNMVNSKVTVNSKLSGSMVRDFPTTAAIALVKQVQDVIYLNSIWAGDSRVYLIDDKGLAQITIDDSNDKDAFSNLREDGPMTNVLSADGKYELHLKSMVIDRPTIIFTATDGCFGYLSTPMEFEYSLIETFIKSSSINEFKDNLKSFYREISGDDFSLGLMAFYYGSFKNMKKSLKKRLDFLEDNYINPINNNGDEDFLKELWKKYRPQYERLC